MTNNKNKTMLILGLIIIAIIATLLHLQDLSLAVSSGLVGYLSKDPPKNNDQS